MIQTHTPTSRIGNVSRFNYGVPGHIMGVLRGVNFRAPGNIRNLLRENLPDRRTIGNLPSRHWVLAAKVIRALSLPGQHRVGAALFEGLERGVHAHVRVFAVDCRHPLLPTASGAPAELLAHGDAALDSANRWSRGVSG